MISGLVSGRIFKQPSERTSKAGKAFVVCKVRASTREGETFFINVIGFKPSVVSALLALEDGDAVSISGELSIKLYTPPSGEPRPSVDLLAHVVVSEYHTVRKRKAMEAPPQSREQLDFDDQLPPS